MRNPQSHLQALRLGLSEANPLISDHWLYQTPASEATARLGDAHLAKIRKALRRSQPLGDERFREEAEFALGERFSLKEAGASAKGGGGYEKEIDSSISGRHGDIN